MVDTAANADSSPAPAEFQELARLLAHMVTLTGLYKIGHKLPQQAIDDASAYLNRLLASRESVTIGVLQGILVADGKQIVTRNPLVHNFGKRLETLAAESITFGRGMPREELQRLAEILNLPPAETKAAFGKLKTDSPFIKVNAVTFKQIGEGDQILKKSEFSGSLEQVVAFIKGETPSTDQKKTEKELPDPDKAAAELANLILEAADFRPMSTPMENAESLLEVIVGSLRRKCEEKLEEPAFRTLQGKKSFAKMLLMLEKELLDRLRSAGLAETLLNAVSDSIRELESDVAVDALASEYLKKRQALDTAENRVTRYLRRSERQDPEAGEALKNKLLGGGLNMEGWRQLAIHSGIQPGGGEPMRPDAAGGGAAGGSGDMPGAQVLLMLLSRLEMLLDPKGKSADPGETRSELKKVAAGIAQEVDAVTTRVNERITQMASVIQGLNAAGDQSEPARKKRADRISVFEILAEIIQELCQPLSVVKCSVDLLLNKTLGEVSEEQSEILNLVAGSSMRLQRLVEKLRDLCGNPASLTPNAKILDYVYGKDKPRA